MHCGSVLRCHRHRIASVLTDNAFPLFVSDTVRTDIADTVRPSLPPSPVGADETAHQQCRHRRHRRRQQLHDGRHHCAFAGNGCGNAAAESPASVQLENPAQSVRSATTGDSGRIVDNIDRRRQQQFVGHANDDRLVRLCGECVNTVR